MQRGHTVDPQLLSLHKRMVHSIALPMHNTMPELVALLFIVQP